MQSLDAKDYKQGEKDSLILAGSQKLGLSEAQHKQPDNCNVTELNCNEGSSLEVMPSEQQLKEALLSGEDLRKTNATLEEVKEKLQHAEEESKKQRKRLLP